MEFSFVILVNQKSNPMNLKFTLKKFILLFLMKTACLLTAAQVYTVDSVPNTKLQNNSYVSNPDGLITSTTLTQLDQLLTALEGQTTAQVAVVMLHSIGDQTDFDFAQAFLRSGELAGQERTMDY